MIASVIVTVSVIGFHAWAGAPSEVSYLASEHRHVFEVRVEFGVSEDDRQVEFHTAQDWVRRALHERWGAGLGVACHFGGLSCEAIARELLVSLAAKGRAMSVEVWEDGENGGRAAVCA